MQEIKKSILYPAISFVLSTVAITILTLVISSLQEKINNIEIQSYKIQIHDIVVEGIIKNLYPEVKFKNNLDKLGSDFIYLPDKHMTIYDVKNNGDFLIDNINVIFGDFSFYYIVENENLKEKVLTEYKDKNIILEILPRKSKRIYVYYDNYISDSDDRFLINGKEIIPNHNINSIYNLYKSDYSFSNIIFKELSNVPIITIILTFIGFISLYVFLMALFLFLLSRYNADFAAKNTGDSVIARNLALMNYIRENYPSRYLKIVSLAEKTFEKFKQ